MPSDIGSGGGRFAVSGGDEDPDDHAAEVAGVMINAHNSIQSRVVFFRNIDLVFMEPNGVRGLAGIWFGNKKTFTNDNGRFAGIGQGLLRQYAGERNNFGF